MSPLVRGVDSAKAGADREFDEGGCPLFFPRRTVEESGIQALPLSRFIVVKTILVAQFLQLFARFKVLNGISARTCEIVIGDGVRHPLQIDIDSILSFLYSAE